MQLGHSAFLTDCSRISISRKQHEPVTEVSFLCWAQLRIPSCLRKQTLELPLSIILRPVILQTPNSHPCLWVKLNSVWHGWKYHDVKLPGLSEEVAWNNQGGRQINTPIEEVFMEQIQPLLEIPHDRWHWRKSSVTHSATDRNTC